MAHSRGSPPIEWTALGYLASRATSPTGEDREEAVKHLEEQSLRQFKADIERQRKVREFARKTLLEGAEDKKQKREIRI